MTPAAQDLLLISTPFVALLGACFGSFLSVCIYRIPRGESIVRPRSHCPNCGRMIPWYWNIPILSWLLLGGKCRWCKKPISCRYILLEVFTSVLFLLVWLQVFYGMTMPESLYRSWLAYDGGLITPPAGFLGLAPLLDPRLLFVGWLAVFGLILGSFIDIEHYILPDRVTIGGMIIGLIVSPLLPELHWTSSWLTALIRSAIGLGVGFGVLWLISVVGSWAFKKEAMGFGDVKLMGAIGAFLGWKAVLFTLFVSSLLGSIVGIALILLRKRELQGRIPYGPFLAAAAVIWMFWGPILVSRYSAYFLFAPVP